MPQLSLTLRTTNRSLFFWKIQNGRCWLEPQAVSGTQNYSSHQEIHAYRRHCSTVMTTWFGTMGYIGSQKYIRKESPQVNHQKEWGSDLQPHKTLVGPLQPHLFNSLHHLENSEHFIHTLETQVIPEDITITSASSPSFPKLLSLQFDEDINTLFHHVLAASSYFCFNSQYYEQSWFHCCNL
jgi:hypothetical protein